MGIVLIPLCQVLLSLLSLYNWALILYVILSWLFVFGVLNPRSSWVLILGNILNRMIQPALVPIRRRLPSLGGLDLSVLVLFFVIYFLQLLIEQILVRL